MGNFAKGWQSVNAGINSENYSQQNDLFAAIDAHLHFSENFYHAIPIYKKIEEYLHALVHLKSEEIDFGLTRLKKQLLDLDNSSLLQPRWLGLLVLESPLIRREFRILLIRNLIKRGITRDFSDIPDVTGHIIGAFIFLALEETGNVQKKYDYLIENWLTSVCARHYSLADVVIAALLLNENLLARLERSCVSSLDSGFFQFAKWIFHVEHGLQTEPIVQSALAYEFFNCHSFRGLRRSWARKRGVICGQAGNFDIEPWLMPVKFCDSDKPVDGQLILLIEWFLSSLRSFVNLNGKEVEFDDTAKAKIQTARESITTLLGDSEKRGTFLSWLDAGMKDLELHEPSISISASINTKI